MQMKVFLQEANSKIQLNLKLWIYDQQRNVLPVWSNFFQRIDNILRFERPSLAKYGPKSKSLLSKGWCVNTC